MVAHLKTIAILSLICSLVCLMVMFPKVSIPILLIGATIVLYYSIYRLVKDKDNNYENLGAYNNGGRDID